MSNSYLFKGIRLSCKRKAAFGIRERKHQGHNSTVKLETTVLLDHFKKTNKLRCLATCVAGHKNGKQGRRFTVICSCKIVMGSVRKLGMREVSGCDMHNMGILKKKKPIKRREQKGS